jgi:hypothetical protein
MNSRPTTQLGSACLSCLAALASAGAGAAEPAATDARAIMAAVYAQDGSRDTVASASFEITDGDGHQSQKKFIYRRLGAPDNRRTMVVFTDPEDVRGVALLSITKAGAPAAQYMYVPATGRVRSVAPQQQSARFLGTDLTFEDIQDHQLEDFSYRLLGSGEMTDGHRTYEIEARPVSAATSQYGLIRYWVAQDMPVIIRTEMFDQQGIEVRVRHAGEIGRVAGIWGARNTEIRTVREGTRTLLRIHEIRFNTGLAEQQFTPEALEALPAQGAGSRVH